MTSIIYIGTLFLANYLLFRLEDDFPILSSAKKGIRELYLLLLLVGIGSFLLFSPQTVLVEAKLYLFMLYGFALIYWGRFLAVSGIGILTGLAYFSQGGPLWSHQFLLQSVVVVALYFLLLSTIKKWLTAFHKQLLVTLVASLITALPILYEQVFQFTFPLVFLLLSAMGLLSTAILQLLICDLAKVRDTMDQDALTRVRNLSKFNKDLSELGKQEARVTVALIDIDFFKTYNDQLGHDAGDIILKSIAQRLRFYFDDDQSTIYRIGGDEFALLNTETSPQEMEQRLNKMAKSIPQQSIIYGGDPISVSLSIGLATLAEDEELSFTIKRADAALYRAKERGRGCIQVA